jgi:hypothetical protein
MGVVSDEIPVCGVQYVGLLHPKETLSNTVIPTRVVKKLYHKDSWFDLIDLECLFTWGYAGSGSDGRRGWFPQRSSGIGGGFIVAQRVRSPGWTVDACSSHGNALWALLANLEIARGKKTEGRKWVVSSRETGCFWLSIF